MGSGAYFDPSYFAWQSERAATSARTVVPLLLDLARPRSVVDLGSGTGAWLEAFVERGVGDVVGLDGDYIDRAQLRIPQERFVACDLADPPQLGRQFDLAITLEAVHYAAEACAPSIVAWLAAHADVVYFAAAVPFQTGGPSLNRQWPGWWGDLFAEHGLEPYDLLRPRLWEDGDVDWWYAQNGVVFARPPALPSSTTTGRPLPLVHPGLLADVAEKAPETATEHPADARRGLGRLRRRR